MVNEEKGIIISIGLIIIANLIKSDSINFGNFVQGMGIGSGLGTLLHYTNKKYPDNSNVTPHHDLTALISIPIIYTIDKTNVIENKNITTNLYGVSAGMLSQHIITEGCSFCSTLYCENNDKLC